MTYEELLQEINIKAQSRSAWDKGVRYLALLLVEKAFAFHKVPASEEASKDEKFYLRGAANWERYANGGSAIITDEEIAEKLAPPSQRNRKPKDGWMEAQERAMKQAWMLVRQCLAEKK